MKDINDIKFERTVWAEMQLAKLCPNNDIKKLGEIVSTEDFTEQLGNIMQIIVIMNSAYERKAHFLDNSHEMDCITVEMLSNLNETELMELSNRAFADLSEDGKTEITTEPKKEDTEPQTESI